MTGVTIWVNGERREVPAGTTLDRLVTDLATDPDASPARSPAAAAGVAAAVNETVIPRGQWPGTALAEGDRVEVLTAVQGG